MKRADRSLKNSLKNAALVVLVLVLLVLTVLAWDTALAGGGSPLLWIQSRLPMGDGGYVQRAGETPAAYPVRIAIPTDDGLVGASYQEAQVSILLESTRALWTQALTQAQEYMPADEAAMRTALSAEAMLLEYAGRVPVSLLAGWFGGEVQEGTAPYAGTLVLAKDGVLYVRDPQDARIYRAKTQVDASLWESMGDAVTAAPCSYASQLEGAFYRNLHPETLVMGEQAAFAIYTERAPAFWSTDTGESLQRLLEAFSYSSDLKPYDEGTGTQVFVESNSSLRIATDGTVRFKATSMTGGLRAYQEGEVEGNDATAAQIDYAQKLLTAALRSVSQDMLPMLRECSINEQTGSTTLLFAHTLGGVPVANNELARFEFSGGVLASAELHLRVFEPTEQSLYVLPAAQAAAVATETPKNYIVAYQTGADGRVLPGAYLK